MAGLAIALVCNSRRRKKQLGEFPTSIQTKPPPKHQHSPKTAASSISRLWGSPTSPQWDSVPRSLERLNTMGCLSTVLTPNLDDLTSRDLSPRAMSLSIFRSGSDYRNGLGELVEAARACPSSQVLIPSPRQHSLTLITQLPDLQTMKNLQRVRMGQVSRCCGQTLSGSRIWTRCS